jgi:hypothetical protein
MDHDLEISQIWFGQFPLVSTMVIVRFSSCLYFALLEHPHSHGVIQYTQRYQQLGDSHWQFVMLQLLVFLLNRKGIHIFLSLSCGVLVKESAEGLAGYSMGVVDVCKISKPDACCQSFSLGQLASSSQLIAGILNFVIIQAHMVQSIPSTVSC